jgi:hypothetical protein
MPIDTERALAFVRAHGEPAERALAEFTAGKLSANAAADALRAHQNGDGGWTELGAARRYEISTLSHTWVGLHWLHELGISRGEMLDASLAFLARSQARQGYWDEPEALLELDPPPWMRPGVDANRVWLTAAVGRCVQQLGRSGDIDFAAVLAYLRQSFGAQGFSAYLHTHWMALPIFSELAPGQRTELDRQILQSCRERLLGAVREHRADPADLAAIARAACVAGEPELLDAASAGVASSQAADGGCTTAYGDANRPAATLEALALGRYLRDRGSRIV